MYRRVPRTVDEKNSGFALHDARDRAHRKTGGLRAVVTANGRELGYPGCYRTRKEVRAIGDEMCIGERVGGESER